MHFRSGTLALELSACAPSSNVSTITGLRASAARAAKRLQKAEAAYAEENGEEEEETAAAPAG
jgi:hypothetical protein